MLLNIYRIQIAFHKEESAVLLILDNNAVNVDAVDFFKNSKEFARTFIVPNVSSMTKYNTRKEKIKHLPEVLLYSKALIRFLENTFPEEFSGFDFDKTYIPGFFNNVIFFLEVISRKNSINKINYYDYGLGSYSWNAGQFTKNIELLSKWEHRIRDMNELPYRWKFLRNITNKMYVWEPECLFPDKKLKGVTIPKYRNSDYSYRASDYLSIKEKYNNDFVFYMCDNVPDISYIAAQNRDIYYFTSYVPGVDEELNLFSVLLGLVRNKNIILKPHVHSPAIAKKIKDKFSKKCFVDSDTYLFEALLCKKSFDNSIIITRLSTAAFSPKLMFNQEPVVILTYKLFQLYREQENINLDQMIERLKKSYSDPSRIMIPTSLLEFKVMISEAQKLIYSIEGITPDNIETNSEGLMEDIEETSVLEEMSDNINFENEENF